MRPVNGPNPKKGIQVPETHYRGLPGLPVTSQGILERTFAVKIAVIVTQEDIDKGRRMDGGHCPVARAASRAVGKDMRMGASLLYQPFTARQVTVPKFVQEWIKDFDLQKTVAPFGFEVELREDWTE